jgi:alpha-methylacyl-CoA racemase
MAGPLEDIRIIEIAGLGPGPFAAMMLADHGADVLRVERPGGGLTMGDPTRDVLNRSRRSITVDMKQPDGVELIRRLCRTADGVIEGFRPGVMERLGLGPDVLLAEHPRLVYGRMTGWGQTGPYAQAAGHDINYIALGGVLHALGRKGQKPTPPANLVGDFGGGGMMLAFGMVSAVHHARRTGEGQVIDCAMTEGAALLMTAMWAFRAQGAWRDERGVNLLDTGAHFYETYETADGRYISIGSIEPQFYAELLRLTDLSDELTSATQMDPRTWDAARDRLEVVFRTKSRDEWCALMEGTDACFAPVLNMEEVPQHPHNRARESFVEIDGIVQPNIAPRYSRTIPARPTMPSRATVEAVLEPLGYTSREIHELQAREIVT